MKITESMRAVWAVMDRVKPTEVDKKEMLRRGLLDLRRVNCDLEEKIMQIKRVLPESREAKPRKALLMARLDVAQEQVAAAVGLLNSANELACSVIRAQGDSVDPRLLAWQHEMAEWLRAVAEDGELTEGAK